MKTKEDLQLEILFKEREILYLSSYIDTYQRKFQQLQVEYKQLEQQLQELTNEKTK